jgi:two-component system response regulator BaeR
VNEPNRRILIVDDDAHGAALLSEYLQTLGYRTTLLMNGLHVEPEVRRAEPALVLLDAQLPGLDGLEVCQRLRRFSAVPIIMVSARADHADCSMGLEVGADDYVSKPFVPREIAARIKAHLRRVEGRVVAGVTPLGYRVDDAARRIAWQDRWLSLTGQEYTLLRRLLQRPGHVLTRHELLEGCGAPRGGSERAIDSHMKNLRRKLQAAGCDPASITSVYGLGYRFESAGPRH